MQNLIVQIPHPCHERWEAMQPTEQGRFCANCQKIVIDYTALSDQEVVQLLNKAPETSCGRFRNEQLGRQLSLSNPGATSVWRQWVGLLAMSLVSWQTTRAQPNQLAKPSLPVSVRPDFSVSTISAQKTFGPDAKRVISGRVMLADTIDLLFPASQATVRVYQFGKEWETQTDSTGAFSLSIPILVPDNPIQSGKIIVATSFPNHSRGHSTINVRPGTTPITVSDIVLYGEAKRKDITGGGICIIKVSRWQKLKRALFH